MQGGRLEGIDHIGQLGNGFSGLIGILEERLEPSRGQVAP